MVSRFHRGGQCIQDGGTAALKITALEDANTIVIEGMRGFTCSHTRKASPSLSFPAVASQVIRMNVKGRCSVQLESYLLLP